MTPCDHSWIDITTHGDGVRVERCEICNTDRYTAYTPPVRRLGPCTMDGMHDARAADPQPSGLLQIQVDGVPLPKCYFFCEVAGVAEAWATDEFGRIPRAVGYEMPTRRVVGRVELVAAPAVRAWYERHFGV